MSKRVLVVTKAMVPPWDDGTKVLVRELVSAPGRYRYLLPVPAGAPLAVEGAEAWTAWPAGGRGTGAVDKAWMLANLARAPRWDLVHLFFAPSHLTALMSRVLVLAGFRPMVHTVCSVPRSLRGLSRLMGARAVVVLSQWARQRFLRAGMDPARLHVIPPGLRFAEPPDGDEVRRVRERYGLGEEPFVLYAGDYDFSETAQLMLDAAVQLCRRVAGVRVLFAVRLKTEQSALVEQRLKARVAQEGLSRRILFVNRVPEFQVLLAAASLCALPAETTFAKTDYPYVLLEAMAAGTPILVSDREALPELVQEGGGVVVRPLDANGVARALEEMLRDPERLRRLGEEARRVARQRFDAGACRREYEALYDALS